MGAAALVPLVISLTLLSKKALDLAGKEEEKSEKVNMMNYLLLISEIISLFSFSCLKDYQMKLLLRYLRISIAVNYSKLERCLKDFMMLQQTQAFGRILTSVIDLLRIK